MWKSIKGYEGLYEVSNDGFIKRLKTSSGHRKTDLILKNITMPSGYETVNLNKDGICKKFLVHRLVALNFIENKNIEMNTIDHINTIKSDNRVENLRWCTQGMNNVYCIQNGRKSRRGENHVRSKIKEQDIRDIRRIYNEGGTTTRKLGKIYGVSGSHIGRIVRLLEWRHVV